MTRVGFGCGKWTRFSPQPATWQAPRMSTSLPRSASPTVILLACPVSREEWRPDCVQYYLPFFSSSPLCFPCVLSRDAPASPDNHSAEVDLSSVAIPLPGGLASSVSSLCFGALSDGRIALASGGDDGTIRVWALGRETGSSGELMHSYSVPDGVTCLR